MGEVRRQGENVETVVGAIVEHGRVEAKVLSA
jgi:hypothetical protein